MHFYFELNVAFIYERDRISLVSLTVPIRTHSLSPIAFDEPITTATKVGDDDDANPFSELPA